jgi:glucosyl-dolichyl phosphate glucuronosyltransferase
MTDLDISVIICAYNEARWDNLLSAISSVQKQTCPPREIIVVIDHNPALFNRVRKHIPQIGAIENTVFQGLSGARNTGVAAAKGELVAFLDDDAVAEPDWLARLAARYTDPHVLGVGGSIEPIWEGEYPHWFPEEFNWVVGCTYRGMPQTRGTVRNLIGCNMSFRRQVYEEVGGFRTGFGQVGAGWLRCDETEFCIRVRQQKAEGVLVYAPEAQVHHRVSVERARWNYFRSRCFTEGLAKAALAQLLGTRDGLSSELTYTLSALPRGILRGLADVLRQRDPAGMARAVVIATGLGLTALGYLLGKFQILFARRQKSGVAVPGAELQNQSSHHSATVAPR